jgi:hypothetical protein
VCFEGFADVSIFVFVGVGFNAELCEACQAPTENSIDMVAYYFELPCEPICGPTDCIETAELQESIGASVDLPDDAIEIVSQDGDTVEFVVNQLWGDVSIEMIAIHYHDSISSQECDMQQGVEIGRRMTYEAVCFEGFADVSIFVFVGVGFNAELCEACQAPAENSNDMVAYYFELPCTPICETAETAETPTPAPQASTLDCYPGPVIQDQVGTCSSTSEPIAIQAQDGNKVTFTVTNNWSGAGVLDQVAVRLPAYPSTDYTCWNSFLVESGAEITTVFEATCINGIAEIEVYLHDGDFGSGDNAQIHSSCSPQAETKNCAFFYVLPCNDCERRLDDLNFKEAFTAEEVVAGVNEPSENDEDIPYCVTEDYPCEGEGSDMVHVCHYSARKGYQTFCIPESDSDILRFYPHDYCGPCEGGYGGAWS